MNKKLIVGIIIAIVVIGILVISSDNFNIATNTNSIDNKPANITGRNITIELSENMKIGENP